MKILMLTPYLPYPLLSGGQIRSYNLLKYLARKHQITLVALIKSDADTQYIGPLQKFCHKVIVAKRPEKPWTFSNILRTGFSVNPFLVVRNYSAPAKEAVVKELAENKFDLIHAETFYVMPHIPPTRIPILLVEQTIEYLVYQHFVDTVKFWPLRLLLAVDVYKIRFWEKYFWEKASRVVAMSEPDKKAMQKLVPGLDVSIVPNGVDTDEYAFNRRSLAKNPTILFVGNFKWLQNREAVTQLVKNIWPIIRKKIPRSRLWIVGKFPTPEILAYQDEQISVSQNVDDIRRAYRNSDMLLAPIYGPGGTRYKILESMATGVAVVTTPEGIEGLGAVDGREALIRGTSSELAEAAVKLLTDSSLYSRLAVQANRFVRTNYNWKSISADLDSLYETVSQSHEI